jgi:hypothetical protein
VVEALRQAIDDADLDNRSFDMSGATRVTFGEFVRAAETPGLTRLGRWRLHLPIPGYGERLVSYASGALSPEQRRETAHLLSTLREPQVCADPSRRFPLPHRPLGLRQALEAVAG